MSGVKGLGAGKIFKLFPELLDTPLTLDDIFDICETKMKEHIIYARILQAAPQLENNYKIMDLENPLINENDIEFLNELVDEKAPDLHSSLIAQLYNEDHLIGIIRNLDVWLKDGFSQLTSYNK